MSRSGSRLATLALLAAVYFAAARAGLLFAVVHPSVSPVWPPTGVAVAALLLLGRSAWPGITVGAALANLATGAGVFAALGIAAGNTGEALVAAALLEALRFDRRFTHPRDVVALIAAAVLAPVVSATAGVASLALTGAAPLAATPTMWWLWFAGDALGLLVVAPALLGLAEAPWRGASARRVAEAAGLVAMLALVGVLFFGGLVQLGESPLSLAYTVFPLVVWAALRFGPGGAALANSAVFALAIWATLRGRGPFQQDSVGEGLVAAQVFVIVETLTALLLAAVMAWRQATEASLRASRAQLAEIQRIASLGGWEWEAATDRVWWSEEFYEVLGLPRGGPSSWAAFLERVHPADRERVAAVVEEAQRRASGFELEHRVVRADGSERDVIGRGRAVVGSAGVLLRMVGTTQDVTERRRAEEQRAALARVEAAHGQAQEANRLKDEFLATLSHELRTPLNSIVGWANLMQGGTLDPTTQKRAVQTIVRSARALTQLISDVLDVSRIAAGKIDLERAPVQLAMVVETAVEGARPSAEARGVEVRVQAAPAAGDDLVLGDADRLLQVVGNVLANAVKFTPRGGRVSVSLEKGDGVVALTVADTGVGIPAEFLPHVFDRFRQAETGTQRRFGGLGLGLSIARDLVGLHGGSIAVESPGPDRGSTFTIRLPALPLEAEAPAPSPDADEWPAPPRLDGVRIVAVEDDPDSREMLGALLVRLGAEVRLAASAAEGLALVQEFRPDVLLSDLEMPGQTGHDLVRSVRALPAHEGGLTPAAALSAHVGPGDRALALEAGFEIHVGKPLQAAEVAMAVAALAARVRRPLP